MSSFDRNSWRARPVALAASLCACLVVAGCQVQPLYSDGRPGSSTPGLAATFAAIDIAPANDRPTQEVRNELIFLLSGGAGLPATPRFTLQLAVGASFSGLLRNPLDGEPTGENPTLTGTYTVTDTVTGQPLVTRTEQATAIYDLPPQEFAKMRARRDGQSRAARELAERIRANLALVLRNERPLGTN
jgi:LPS-assembly lipoprotein